MGTRLKKQSFLSGAMILAVGTAVVKLIGALFKIPLYSILGEAGSADFYNAYSIYAALLTISTAGLPVALSKMVSEAHTLHRENQVQRIFQVSFLAFLTMGLFSFGLMWFGNDFLASLLHNPRAALGIKALAPAVVCVGCLAAFRGYAQGHSNMTPTAVSQIIEALCKLVIGLGLAVYALKIGKNDTEAAAAAILGVTVGTVLALAYMAVNYFRNPTRREKTADVPEERGTILKQLLSIAIPITLSASMVSIITLIDTSFVQGRLQSALGYTLEEMRVTYGTYSSGMNLYNLPSSFMTALTISVIPSVSGALTRKDYAAASRITNSSLRVTALLAFPMGFGLWAMATPIMALLYPKYDSVLGGSLLSVLGIASIFVCVTLLTNSILQAHGFISLPVVTMLVGGVAELIVDYNLVAIPSVNIHGAPIGTVVCFGIPALLNLWILSRVLRQPPNYLKIFLKPLLASLLMGFCAKGIYALLSPLGNRLALLGAILCAVIFYGLLVIFLRIITREDLLLLPKGDKIAKILHIH